MSAAPFLSRDEWIWRTDLAARQAEAAGFSYTAEAFRTLSGLEAEGHGSGTKLGLRPIQEEQVAQEPMSQKEAEAR